MASRVAKSYKVASLELEKLPIDGFICTTSVGERRSELDPPVAIEAGQRVSDLVSVDFLFAGPDTQCILA